ncbi:major facilitator superfamily domain-containing protein [Dichotomopilus funicola]|uniref:Major facilitator superfamily domain-containing protein n=1 Tax=Dichotomopilus funicola TaxID=1934379 RepID=A0AAN6ZP05_9PEZI|nr:major facilitator superfamily domain-containing protein [Dichotomopilus funicola]
MAVVPSIAAEHGHAVPDYPPKTQDCPQDPEKTVTPEDVTEEESGPPSPPVEQLQRWNESPINRFRYLTTNYCFALMGMTDGSLGALLPYIESYYSISYTVVSLVFLSPFVGYLLAALLNNLIHHYFGQRGVAIIGPVSRLIGIVPLVFHPPYPALPVILLFSGFGNGIEDSAWNAWVGNMQHANELLGFLHGSYGLGATIGPLIATAMVTRGGLPWYTFYFVMIGAEAVALSLAGPAFWSATAKVHRAAMHAASSGSTESSANGADGGTQTRTTTRTVLLNPITWLVAFFLLGYVGAEVSLGGWITTFMLKVRHAEPFLAGLSSTFFWLGLTVGRVALGFVTGKIGEKFAISLYLVLSVALQLLYWLVPNFAASATFVALLGFFLGPLFPAAIVAATKLLPKSYHVSAIGFAAAFGGGGAAIFPFAVGAIAQHKGVEVLQPIVLAILAFILAMWLLLPGGLRVGGLERARENRETVGQNLMRPVAWVKKLKKTG